MVDLVLLKESGLIKEDLLSAETASWESQDS